MRILLLSDWYHPAVNGVVVSVENLRRGLLALGHDVRLMTLSQDRRSYYEDGIYWIGSHDAGLIYPGARLRSPAATAFSDELAYWSPDILHTNCEFSNFYIALHLKKLFGIPLIHTYHTMYEDYTQYFSPSKAMGKAAASFLAAGKKVAYIGVTKEDKAVGVAREEGFRAGLKAAGTELEEACMRKAEFTMESGYEAALDLLRSNADIGVISCATDTIAAGAIEGLLAYGRKKAPQEAEDCGGRMENIPGSTKIRVTGFGDNQFLKAVTGGIPTVHFGYKTSGIRGAELLLDVIERGEKIPVEMKLGFRMVNGQEG